MANDPIDYIESIIDTFARDVAGVPTDADHPALDPSTADISMFDGARTDEEIETWHQFPMNPIVGLNANEVEQIWYDEYPGTENSEHPFPITYMREGTDDPETDSDRILVFTDVFDVVSETTYEGPLEVSHIIRCRIICKENVKLLSTVATELQRDYFGIGDRTIRMTPDPQDEDTGDFERIIDIEVAV